MSNKYGYVGKDVPTQSFGSNKGVLNTDDLYELSNAGKLTQYGQLELIETQTASADSSLDFISLGSYNVHFLTYSFDGGASDVGLFSRFSNNGGTSFIASGYHYAQQRGDGEGGFGEYRSTSMWAMQICNLANIGTAGHSFNGYIYYYNLLDSSKYSFQTNHSSYSDREAANTVAFNFGSGVYPTAETHNALNIFPNTSTITGQASLYGIRYS